MSCFPLLKNYLCDSSGLAYQVFLTFPICQMGIHPDVGGSNDATSKILELINEMIKLLSICLLWKKYIHVFCPFSIDDEDDEL